MIRTVKWLCSIMPILSFVTEPVPAAAAPKPKLRILCLHGFHGSGAILSRQMGSLRATLEAEAELVFADAPSLADGKFGWWHAIESKDSLDVENPGVEGSPQMHYAGWDETKKWLIDTFKTKGPFDGVLGFSQGAALTALAVGMRSPDHKTSAQFPLDFQFAIEFSGFPARDPALFKLYSNSKSFDLPSLHFVGKTDGIVPPERTLALSSSFKNPQIFHHSDGHIIPTTAAAKDTITDFLKQQAHLSPSLTKESVPKKDTLVIPLWPDRSRPSMRVQFPEKSRYENLSAMLVLPGGAYATDSGSGSDAAVWLAKQGIVGIKVEYATQNTNERHPAAIQDAARALRLVRKNAKEWGIDPRRVGVMGFSAGGHLASLLATQPSLTLSARDDLIEKFSAKPNLLVLAYPLISFVDGYRTGAFAGSVENFFGISPVPEAKRMDFSSELHASADTPPTFIWTTDDDSIVPSSHSKLFAVALQRAKVAVKFNLYQKGRHGLGLALGEPSPVSTWPKDLLQWLDGYWK